MMSPWIERPVEISNLLNPAFAGVLLRKAVEGYRSEAEAGMPVELAFLVMPIGLHPGTAKRLPARPSSTPLHAWLQREENRDVIVRFEERVGSLAPFTREAIIFAAQRRVLDIDEGGRIVPGAEGLRGFTAFKNSGAEIKDAISHCLFVGRWLALSGTPATIYSLLGVRP